MHSVQNLIPNQRCRLIFLPDTNLRFYIVVGNLRSCKNVTWPEWEFSWPKLEHNVAENETITQADV